MIKGKPLRRLVELPADYDKGDAHGDHEEAEELAHLNA